MSELWQQLWEQSEESNNISIQDYPSENNSIYNLISLIPVLTPGAALGVRTNKWNPNPQPDCPSFPIGSKITYQFNLNNSGYLIVTEKSASGEIYCLAPSNLSPAFPARWGRLVIPKDDVFTVQPPIGYEEILAIFSQDEPQLNWLPQPQDYPLELQTNHLADLVNYVKKNKCDLMRYKYLITT